MTRDIHQCPAPECTGSGCAWQDLMHDLYYLYWQEKELDADQFEEVRSIIKENIDRDKLPDDHWDSSYRVYRMTPSKV